MIFISIIKKIELKQLLYNTLYSMVEQYMLLCICYQYHSLLCPFYIEPNICVVYT